MSAVFAHGYLFLYHTRVAQTYSQNLTHLLRPLRFKKRVPTSSQSSDRGTKSHISEPELRITDMFALCVMMLALVGIRVSVSAEPSVSFPPARPSLANLNALCNRGDGRPRYPALLFPASGHGHQRRCGAAINRVEAWYGMCCAAGKTQGQTLCCAKQAWEYALKVFCMEEFMVKDLPHECCEEERGEARWRCFEREAPNPYYQAIPGYTAPSVSVDLGFTWDANAC
ncbi:hypothetical protein ACEWY4_023929 [Coilia grayii]|uniref:Extracellular matrix protein 1-like n=1 Tax=Coilia grayii TaxID=363190 RepID=A0ABD1J200_9TELE